MTGSELDVVRMEESRIAFKIIIYKNIRKTPLESSKHRWENYIRTVLQEV